VDSQQSVKNKDNSIQILCPTHTLMSSKDRWIGPNHSVETWLSEQEEEEDEEETEMENII
jgi:hypothetical protein